jgi:hypothetical protein
VQRCADIDRAVVRASFDARFTVQRMTDDYLDIYQRLPFRKPGRVAA